MDTTPYTLRNGKAVQLAMPDLYSLVATGPTDRGMISLPNEALTAILDLITYGPQLSLPDDNAKRAKENKEYLLAQWGLAALCIVDPPLVLRGDVPPGALGPRDIHPSDLNAISTFFQAGGSSGVSATTDSEPGQDTPDDRAGATVADDAG